MTPTSKWFVFYTKSRQEKKVRDFLLRRDFEVFLPTQKVMRQWSDRKKKVEVPLFNSYVFVFTDEQRIAEVLKVPGIAWAIRHNGKVAVLQQREYELIKRFLDTGLIIDVHSAQSFQPGEWVQVLDGPLRGAIGQVTAQSPNRFTVLLDAIGQVMRVDLEPGLLNRLNFE
jgi:transcription antitermination factor NusG